VNIADSKTRRGYKAHKRAMREKHCACFRADGLAQALTHRTIQLWDLTSSAEIGARPETRRSFCAPQG
jgi:hypothetical protein